MRWTELTLPDRRGHGCSRPIGRLRGRSSQGQGYHALGNIWVQGRDSRRTCLVAPQPSRSFSAKSLLPAPNDRLGLSGLPHDSAVPWPPAVSRTILARQTCFCGLLRLAAIASNSALLVALSSFVHSPDSHDRSRRGIRKANVHGVVDRAFARTPSRTDTTWNYLAGELGGSR